MGKILRNDFLKWHASFVTLYLLTFLAGWLRESSSFFYKIHPYVGISSVVIPLIVYMFLKNKRLIRQMIKSNFNLKGRGLMKVAKISTLVIIFYYFFSIFSGMILNYRLYGSFEMYKVIHTIHALAKLLVPLAVATHMVARLLLKKKKSA